MKCKVVLSTLFALLVLPVFAAEEIAVDYTYEGNIRADFSNIPRGPLGIGAFTDARSVDNPNLIAEGNGGYMADKPLTDIVRDALVQGFTKGKATLADSDANMTIQGTINSSEVQIVDDNGTESIQLTIRTSIQLRSGGRTLWETTLFGRGTAPVADGMQAALSASLDRTIRNLVQDDYFLIEVL
jgi:hypothetical protein